VPISQLSPREQEVLACIASGLGNKEVAARLGISRSTVKGYLESILQKLQVPNRAAAAALWAKYAARSE